MRLMMTEVTSSRCKLCGIIYKAHLQNLYHNKMSHIAGAGARALHLLCGARALQIEGPWCKGPAPRDPVAEPSIYTAPTGEP